MARLGRRERDSERQGEGGSAEEGQERLATHR